MKKQPQHQLIQLLTQRSRPTQVIFFPLFIVIFHGALFISQPFLHVLARFMCIKCWLPPKVYYNLLSAFICLLQPVEGHDVGRIFSCIRLQNHRINSSPVKLLWFLYGLQSFQWHSCFIFQLYCFKVCSMPLLFCSIWTVGKTMVAHIMVKTSLCRSIGWCMFVFRSDVTCLHYKNNQPRNVYLCVAHKL